MHKNIFCLVKADTPDWEEYSYDESDFYENAFVLANTDYVSDFDIPEAAIANKMNNLPDYIERTGERTFRYDVEKLREMFTQRYYTFKSMAQVMTPQQFMEESDELSLLEMCICDHCDDIIYCEGFGTMWLDDFHRAVISGHVSSELALVGRVDCHM